MARKVLIEGYGYSFDKDNRKVTIQKFIPEERLILITNVTKNKVIYNFSDPSLGYSAYVNSFDPATGNESCLITLTYDTSLMSNSDQLQILIDEDAQLITPSQTYMDPTNKMRVTTPQSLIDTDFEYGTQLSKWETQGLIGNRPYFFASPTVIPNVSSISMGIGSKTVNVTSTTAHGLQVGTPILVIDSFFGQANGNFVVESVTSTQFVYTARAINNSSTTELLDPNKTALYQGNIFANAAIGTAPTAISYNGSTGATVVTTSIPHGLALGNEVAIIGTSGMTGGTLNGNYVVAQINSATQFTYYGPTSLTGTPIGTAATATASPTGTSFPINQPITNQIQLNLPTNIVVGQNITGIGIAPGTVINAISVQGSQIAVSSTSGTGSVMTYNTGTTHTFVTGQSVTITGASIGGFNVSGIITSVPTTTSFTLAGTATGSATGATAFPQPTITLSNVTTQALTNTSLTVAAAVYVRPQAQTNHRPFDGGVLFSNNSLSNFSTNIRQSRRYFRYQSGKGMSVSSGTILKPYSGLDQMTAGARITAATGNGTTVTYTAQNNFLPGQVVTITGLGIASGASLNLVAVTIASATSTQFTVTNATLGTATSAIGLALGNTITVQTKERHNITPGTTISVTGSTDVNYNGTWTVSNILAWNRYQFVVTNTPTTVVAPGNPAISVESWSGASTRLGMFDNQNGVFFEFDGTVLNAVRRSSTAQLAGKVTVAFGSPFVEQTDTTFATQFGSQVEPGDYVVIRGFSYRVTDVLSETQMLISPQYRGANAQFVTMSKTINTKIPQSQWNLDRMDGTGNSGYVTDLSKMQMFYVDYTWYGAGFVRWGLRGVKGDVTYAHKMPNNNVNTEAYMRSGNLPARYEINNDAATTILTGSIDASQTTSIPVADNREFPTAGTVAIRQVNLTTNTNTVTGISAPSAGLLRFTTASSTNVTVGQPVRVSGITQNPLFNGTYIVSATTGTTFDVISNLSTVGLPLSGLSGTWTTNTYVTNIEYVNYTGKSGTTALTGLTRGRAGTAAVTLNTVAANTAIGTPAGGTSTIQPGMRVIGVLPTTVPENTFVVSVVGSEVRLSNAVTSQSPSVIFVPMGAGNGVAFTYSLTNPIAVELAFPSFTPTISHWGTSVIMDGRFDDDKSLLFTYGQTTPTTLGNNSGYYLITGASGNGTTVTYNTSDTTGLVAGQQISISGATTTTAYNLIGATISNVVTNQSFSVLSNVQGVMTGTPIATFGEPVSQLIAGTAGSNAITLPNLQNITIGQVIAGDTARFPATSRYLVNAVTTSQPGNISSIATATATQAITAITPSAGVVTYATANTTGIVAGQWITVTGATTAAYNGTFLVNAVNTNSNFTVISNATGAGSTATWFVYSTTYTLSGGDVASPTVVNRYVSVKNAITPGFNGTFITTAAVANTSFTVISQTPLAGITSTAQVIVYSATLNQNIVGSGNFYQNANLYGANQKALFSIRIAPSVDNGIPATLGAREVINRMQLILKSLGLTTSVFATGNPPTNVLVSAVLNGVPTSTVAWTNVTRNQTGVANSSLAMIADYAGTYTILQGGENTGGFLTDGTSTLDLVNVRDLGNSILGGGGTTSNTNIFPDGPDTLTIIATNLSNIPVFVSGRLSWGEAQA
ncbi:hypothetical protein UFOVP1119_94 [uncultured Caudovirales phage]|uniref:Uncharacterized protein n=1 Tax=uncultured Caudovirales phage TaxID=2100421 RepID=A0A6J5RIN2_9CAUD|nr:hypothetical protein UFOVP1119_94 [uncultured Caudovirales phage]CAB4193411.1 hypothetical protein UFOVP1238_68 [uncultured Caudovirales phage]